MGHNLRRIMQGELVILSGLGLFLLAEIMPIGSTGINRIWIGPWLILLMSSMPVALLGGFIMIIDGTLGGTKNQPVRVIGIGIFLVFIGFELIMTAGFMPIFRAKIPWLPEISPYTNPVFTNALFVAFIFFGILQTALGLIMITLTVISAIE